MNRRPVRALRAFVVVALAVTPLIAAEPRRADVPSAPRGENREKVRTPRAEREPQPDDKSLTSENDVRFALTETDGCQGDRVRDYLELHGDNGIMDPEILLYTARETYEALERERRSVRGLAIGGTVWTSLGPNNGAGRLTAVATHPTTAGTAIVGAAGGGLWKTTDTGATWTALTESISNLSVGAVAYAPSNANVIYLGTGEGGYAFDFIPGFGLLVSTDGGTNWTLPSTVVASMFYRILVSPTDSNELVIATNQGALRSTNGQNGPWTTVISRATYGDVTDMVRDPSNANTIYAAAWGCSSCTFTYPQVLKSTDGGASFNPSSTGLPTSGGGTTVDRMALAIAPSSTSTLYCAFETLTSGVYTSRVYKTTNSGGNWTETNLSANANSQIRSYLNGQGWYDNTIVVAPADANTVIVGGVYYARSTDGGTSWSNSSFMSGVHVDAHDLRYDTGGTLWIANDGGLWTSTNHGTTVTSRNTNLVTRQFYAMSVDPVNRNRVYGGQQDNGTSYRDDAGTTSWSTFTGGDGFQTGLNERAPAVVYSTIQYGVVNRTRRGTAVSPNYPTTFSPPYPSNETGKPFFSLLVVDPSNPATIYTGSYRVWKSTTGGDAWVPLSTTADAAWSTSQSIRAIAISKSNPQIIMVAKNRFIFRSTDGGSSWVRGDDVEGLPFKIVTNVEIHPTDPNIAFATTAGQSGTAVYYTTNGGTNWIARGTGLPAYSALVVRFDPTDPTVLYCGTDIGVYRSTDNGANWSRFGTDMPAVSVYDLRYTADGAMLRAATHGRGIWQLTVTGVTNNAPTATITTPASTQTVAKGTTVTFSGTFSDANGDPLTATWFFPDTWTTTTASSGVSTTHTFNRAGRFPVTLVATDPSGAKGGAQIDIIVTESGETCASPIVIPASGPFPYTVTVNLEESTDEPNDPVPSCYPYGTVNGVWLSFTPASSGTYTVTSCGSKSSAVIAGFTGSGCGPSYTENGACVVNTTATFDCSTDDSDTFAATGGTTYKFYLTSYYTYDKGPVSFTILNAAISSTTPVIHSISPASGTASGGTPVTITGSGFQSGATVSIGGVAATGVTFINSSLLTAITGARAQGTVDASVTSGTTGTLKDAFTYTAAALDAPTNVVAIAASTSQVNVTWNAVSGATSYDVYRKAAGGSYVVAGSPATNSFSDTGRTANKAYQYKVVARDSGGGSSPDSSTDVATTTIFTTDPLVAGSTTIAGTHLSEIRTAVNAMQELAAQTLTTWTDTILSGVAAKAVHITEIRTALSAARTVLGQSALTYTNTITPGALVRAVDFNELRNGTK